MSRSFATGDLCRGQTGGSSTVPRAVLLLLLLLGAPERWALSCLLACVCAHMTPQQRKDKYGKFLTELFYIHMHAFPLWGVSPSL
eukprot:g81135.t1